MRKLPTIVLSLAVLVIAPNQLLAVPKTPVAQVKCECRCEKAHEGGSGETILELLGNKVFAAPGGDPTRCAGMNGTTCRSGNVEGKLSKCSGVVERKGPKAQDQAVPPAGVKQR
jgi:hypothetical protein